MQFDRTFSAGRGAVDLVKDALGVRKSLSILLLINGNSRSGLAVREQACERFQAKGVKVVEELSESAEHACELIEKYQKKVDTIVLCGGDGTLHYAAPALLKSKLPLGILPLGTANDLARSLKIPRELDDAIDLILSGETTNISLGRVNGTPFFNVANVGLGADVNRAMSGGRKKRWGALSYARTATNTVRHRRNFEYSLTLDGHKVKGRSIQLAVGNGRFYGGGMTVHYDADLRKPEFAVYSLPPASVRKQIQRMPRFALGMLNKKDGTLTARAKEIDLATSSLKQIYADGEKVAFTPAHFEITKEQITVFSPLDTLRPLNRAIR